MSEKVALFDDSNTKVGEWEKLAIVSIESCPKIKKDREKKIVLDRFGIGKSPKTLNSIGTQYAVTRERIRQIVNNAVKKITNSCPSKELEGSIHKIEELVVTNGGFASNEMLFEKFGAIVEREQNALKFIAVLSVELTHIKESNILRQGYAHRSLKETKIRKISQDAVAALKNGGKVLSTKDISDTIGEKPELVKSTLTATKAIMMNDSDKWGLMSWPHVNPKSIKDKSIYVLKRHTKPIHYSELTKKIGEVSGKKVTQQSVHNELIKNQEFVLVGRGIYALSEWGYTPGVVEDVIVEVMTEAGEGLHKNDIINLVLKKENGETKHGGLESAKTEIQKSQKSDLYVKIGETCTKY